MPFKSTLQLTSAPLALFSPLSWKLIYNPNSECCPNELKTHTKQTNKNNSLNYFTNTPKIPKPVKLLKAFYSFTVKVPWQSNFEMRKTLNPLEGNE